MKCLDFTSLISALTALFVALAQLIWAIRRPR